MTTRSMWGLRGLALALAASQAVLGAWTVAVAIEARDGYAWGAAIGLTGGLVAFAALLAVPRGPKIAGAVAYWGALLGLTLWVSVVAFFLTVVLLPTVLGVTIFYDGMRASAAVKLVLWGFSVLLLWLCFLGLFLIADFLAPAPFGYWILAPAVVQIPLLLVVLASASSKHPTSVMARAGG